MPSERVKPFTDTRPCFAPLGSSRLYHTLRELAAFYSRGGSFSEGTCSPGLDWREAWAGLRVRRFLSVSSFSIRPLTPPFWLNSPSRCRVTINLREKRSRCVTPIPSNAPRLLEHPLERRALGAIFSPGTVSSVDVLARGLLALAEMFAECEELGLDRKPFGCLLFGLNACVYAQVIRVCRSIADTLICYTFVIAFDTRLKGPSAILIVSDVPHNTPRVAQLRYKRPANSGGAWFFQ